MGEDPLVAERAAVLAQIEALAGEFEAVVAASRSSNADDEHDPEGATIAFERAQLTAVRDATRRRLADLDDALRRQADGTYGVCESCGRPIPAERLEARPASRTCVPCATRR